MKFHLRYFPSRCIRIFKNILLLFIPMSFCYGFITLMILSIEQTKQNEKLKILTNLLEQESICDRITEFKINRTDLHADESQAYNASVIELCRQFELSRRNYFRKRMSKVNTFKYSFLDDANGACAKETRLVMIVHSLHDYADRRLAIRRTWGGAAVNSTWPGKESVMGIDGVRIVFIFGQNTNAEMEKILREESRLFGDIVQGNFVESYRNMTLKSLLGLKWFQTYCSGAKFLLKCDDDMFINVPDILRAFLATNMTSWSIMGPLNIASKVQRFGKWGLSKEQYPFVYFPPYESGSGYVITADLVRPLSDLAEYVPHIFIDDVYITGILGKILDVRHVRRSGFAYWTNKQPTACEILSGAVLTGTKVTPKIQYQLWKDIVSRGGKQCDTISNS